MNTDPETTSNLIWFIPIITTAVVLVPLWFQHRYFARKYRRPSSNTWMAAREKKQRGEFQRKVKQRVAVSLERDELELECGHRQAFFNKPEESYECQECLDAWVKTETRAGR